MANASRKHMGVGAQGKGSGSGAATEIDKDKIGDNMVLSNRDKRCTRPNVGSTARPSRTNNTRIKTATSFGMNDMSGPVRSASGSQR